MKIIIVGKNMDVTPALESAIREKLGKLERFFASDIEVRVTLQVQKDRQTIEVTIPVKDDIIRSEQTSNDMYVSLDLAEEVIERQLKRYKNRIIDRHHAGGAFKDEYLQKDYADDEDIKIVRKKVFDMKPMYPEDACVEMELLGHNFYVFCNAETEKINVVYKRKGGTYGLIEPEA
ncbi:MAG: ribosome-associated translation inhibitor RaiA [Lachnospiraceae bacterium]|jgi:putative sigma-54 modulation protein|nr:ribosome-associated translation inhibitor RaiA [Lachnospiraceae bacterium]